MTNFGNIEKLYYICKRNNKNSEYGKQKNKYSRN